MGIFIEIGYRGVKMLIETLGLSFMISKIKGGKIKNLEQLHIRGWYLFLLGFMLEIISLWVFVNTNDRLATAIVNNFLIIQISTYILLILGLLLNIRKKGIKSILIGTGLNFIPVVANNGRMPVSQTGLVKSYLYEQLELLKNSKILTHILAGKNTKFYYLSDIIPIPKPYPFPKIISIGDIIISIGIFLLIQFYMKEDINNF